MNCRLNKTTPYHTLLINDGVNPETEVLYTYEVYERESGKDMVRIYVSCVLTESLQESFTFLIKEKFKYYQIEEINF